MSARTIDFSKYEQKAPAPIDFSKYENAAPAEEPGYFSRLGESLGLPTSIEELHAAAKEQSKPSRIVERATLGPLVDIGRMAINYGKTAIKGLQEGGGEVQEADTNVAQGGPFWENAGKAAHGAMHSILQATPIIGPAIETAGEDISGGNYRGAAGGLTGVIGQVAAPKIIESAPKVGPIISEAVNSPTAVKLGQTAKLGLRVAGKSAEELPVIGGVVKAGKALGGLRELPEIWDPSQGSLDFNAKPIVGHVAQEVFPEANIPRETSGVVIQSTPKTGAQVPAPSSEAYRAAPVPEGTVIPEGDMTPLLKEMRRRVRALKKTQGKALEGASLEQTMEAGKKPPVSEDLTDILIESLERVRKERGKP